MTRFLVAKVLLLVLTIVFMSIVNIAVCLSQVTERAERYESAIEELTARIKNVSRLYYYQLF